MKKWMIILLHLSIFSVFNSNAENLEKNDSIITLRKGIAIDTVDKNPAQLQTPSDKNIRKKRAYPMQPPSIPHKIDGYQVNLRANKCLSCHARNRVEESQAPMISVTHFMDRDGNFLADVSPRRYFCNQCHVTQVERTPLLNNTFQDASDLISPDSKKY